MQVVWAPYLLQDPGALLWGAMACTKLNDARSCVVRAELHQLAIHLKYNRIIGEVDAVDECDAIKS